MAHTSSLTPGELSTPCLDAVCATSDRPIVWMQDIIDHAYALVESIPDEDRAALMPIIRFVRNTLPNPITALQESLHGSTVDALKNTHTAWMQMHDNHGIGTNHGPHKETQAVLHKYAFLEQNQSHGQPSKDAVKRHDASIAHICTFRGTSRAQHCYPDYNLLNSHQASMPWQSITSWHSAEGPYKQSNSYGTLPPTDTGIKRRFSLSKHQGQTDEFHQLREGFSLSCSTYTSQCEPSSLTSFKRESEGSFDVVCSSLDMDSFNLEELRRSLRPPVQEMDSNVNGIQSTDVSNYDGDVDGHNDNRDEDDGNVNHDEEPDASDTEWPLYWGNDLQYHPMTLTEDQLQFPKVHRRRRNVIKKVVGWIKKRAADSLVSRVRHKRKCKLPCCVDHETGTKRRKASGQGSKKCPSLSTLNKITSSTTATMATNSEFVTKSSRQSHAARTVEGASDNSETCDEKEASQVTQECENSPLATALATVLANSRGHGLTFCEVLQALAQEGYSKTLGYESEALASHVKTVLKECTQFKELKNHRFVLNAGPKLAGCDQGVLISLHNDLAFGSKNFCGQNQRNFTKELSPMQVKRFEDPTEKIDRSSSRKLHQKRPGELKCRKADGKRWQCSQSAMPGFVYCERHQKSCATRMATSGCSSCEIIDSCDASCDGRKHEAKEEEMLETVADSCSGQSDQDCQAEPIRCCRTDGKTWQCSNQAQEGSIYCARHQNRSKKGAVKRHLHVSCISEEKKDLKSEEATEQNPNVSAVKKFSMQLRPRRSAAASP